MKLATEADYVGRSALLFSRAPAQQTPEQILLRKPNKFGIGHNTSFIDKAFSIPFKAIKWDRIVSKNTDHLLAKIGDIIPETVKAGVVDNYGLDSEYIDIKADMKAAPMADEKTLVVSNLNDGSWHRFLTVAVLHIKT
jgi:hypothetical protein